LTTQNTLSVLPLIVFLCHPAVNCMLWLWQHRLCL